MNIKKFTLSILLLIVIAYLSLMPTTNVSNIKLFHHQDKIIHMLMYLILSLSILYGFYKQIKLNKYYKIITVLTAGIYGILLEFCQILFTSNRQGEILDSLANIIGAILSIIIFNILINLHLIKKRVKN